jgi:hypothetical protein
MHFYQAAREADQDDDLVKIAQIDEDLLPERGRDDPADRLQAQDRSRPPEYSGPSTRR